MFSRKKTCIPNNLIQNYVCTILDSLFRNKGWCFWMFHIWNSKFLLECSESLILEDTFKLKILFQNVNSINEKDQVCYFFMLSPIYVDLVFGNIFAVKHKKNERSSANEVPSPSEGFTNGLVSGWYSSNIAVLVLNKYLLSNNDFKYSIFLTHVMNAMFPSRGSRFFLLAHKLPNYYTIFFFFVFSIWTN